MAYPVADLAGFLSGAWCVERTLDDRRAGRPGRFTGSLTFSPAPEGDGASTPSPAITRLRSEESGTLAMDGLAPVPARRSHRWSVSGDRAEVLFEDGRPFHTLRLSTGRDEPRHWCAPDEYSGAVTAQSPASMLWQWRVRGPRKDLLITTELTRPLPVITVSAVQLTSPAGGLILVRKRGTRAFMQPGGKPEPGESPVQAARRELAEELGLELPASAFRHQHAWRGRPANERGVELYSENFAVTLPSHLQPEPAAEIAELIVLSPGDQRTVQATGIVTGLDGRRHAVAPLLRERILPDLLAQA